MIKNLIAIKVAGCKPAEKYDETQRKFIPKVDKDGNQVFSLLYVTEKENSDLGLTETSVEKISSLIELKPGDYVLEVEVFCIKNKIFYKVISVLKEKK